MADTTHVMRYVGKVPDGDYEFICDVCGKHMLISSGEPGIAFLNHGDQTVNHSGSTCNLFSVDGANVYQ